MATIAYLLVIAKYDLTVRMPAPKTKGSSKESEKTQLHAFKTELLMLKMRGADT